MNPNMGATRSFTVSTPFSIYSTYSIEYGSASYSYSTELRKLLSVNYALRLAEKKVLLLLYSHSLKGDCLGNRRARKDQSI